MRALILALAVFGWLRAAAWAADPPAVCFDTDSNAAFPVSNPPTEDDLFGGKMPSVDYDAEHRPTGMTWSELPAGEEFRIEWIGMYGDNTIYRCTYRQREQPAGEKPSFDLIVFSYVVPAGKKNLVQPFCIVSGDDVGTFENYFAASAREPFTLKISETASGAGDIYSVCTFVFTPREAYLRERSEGGRHSPQKTYRYDRTGKIVPAGTARRK